jgi:predicted transposase YbfD/YdcC
VVSLDAAGCQKKIAEQIKNQKGNYVLGLKKNHLKLFTSALDLQKQVGESDANRLYDTFDMSHGRCVRRRVFGYDARKLEALKDWTGAKSIMAVETISSHNTNPQPRVTAEWRYYLSAYLIKTPKMPASFGTIGALKTNSIGSWMFTSKKIMIKKASVKVRRVFRF